MPQSAGEGPAAPRGLFRGRDLVVWVAALSRPCYTQSRAPWKVLPAGIPEDSRVLVTPCSSCYLGAGSLHTGSPHVEQGRGGSRLRTTVRVGRARRAPWVLWAVCNLLSLEAGFHPGGHQHSADTGATRSPHEHPAHAGPAPTSQQGPVFLRTELPELPGITQQLVPRRRGERPAPPGSRPTWSARGAVLPRRLADTASVGLGGLHSSAPCTTPAAETTQESRAAGPGRLRHPAVQPLHTGKPGPKAPGPPACGEARTLLCRGGQGAALPAAGR